MALTLPGATGANLPEDTVVEITLKTWREVLRILHKADQITLPPQRGQHPRQYVSPWKLERCRVTALLEDNADVAFVRFWDGVEEWGEEFPVRVFASHAVEDELYIGRSGIHEDIVYQPETPAGQSVPPTPWPVTWVEVGAAGSRVLVKITGFTSPSTLGGGKYWGRIQQLKEASVYQANSTNYSVASLYEDASETDVLVQNLYETGGSSHDLQANSYYRGDIVGTTDGDTPYTVVEIEGLRVRGC